MLNLSRVLKQWQARRRSPRRPAAEEEQQWWLSAESTVSSFPRPVAKPFSRRCRAIAK